MRIISVVFLMLLILSCAEDKKEGTTTAKISKSKPIEASSDCEKYLADRKDQNYNISILIDLSSRIEVTNQQSKDSAYIVSIAKTFSNHVKNKKLGLLKDKIQVLFHPAPRNAKINGLSEELKVSFVKGVSKNEWLPKTEMLYQKLPTEIYDLARVDAIKTGGYPGSDIWRFFEDDVNDYTIDNCSRNILIILTDGYMFYAGTKMEENNRTSYLTPRSLKNLNLNTPNWNDKIIENNLGFIPANENLNDLEVLVLGINSFSNDNPYTLDIIEAYWSKWLKEMGVSKFKIKNADIPSNMEKVITNFINE